MTVLKTLVRLTGLTCNCQTCGQGSASLLAATQLEIGGLEKAADAM